MNLIERAVKSNNDEQLINAVLYKLAQKFGRQYASSNFLDLVNSKREGHILSKSASTAGKDDYYGELTRHIVEVLKATYLDSSVTVHLSEHYPEGSIEPVVNFYVDVLDPDEENFHHINFRVELHQLDVDFDAVDIERLIELKKIPTGETPIYVLKYEEILEITGLTYTDDYIIDSVSIAALAAGWSDTNQHGLSLLLID